MAGLPHYKNSIAAQKLYDPIFNAYFDIMITPPAGITDWPLVMNNILKIEGIALAKFPEGKATQKYKGAVRTFVGGAVPDQSQELSLSFEVNLNDSNSMYVYKALRQWSDLAYNPLTGKMGMKRDYHGGPIVITQFNANGDIFRQITYQVCIPLSQIKGPDAPDWESSELYKVDGWKLGVDDWDEVWL
jgi:hypothetical protein